MTSDKTIWKFPLDITDLQPVRMPQGAQILSVQMQYDRLVLWAVVDPEAKGELRTIEIIGTGNLVNPASRQFIGTVQMNGGLLVWHIFERTA